METVTAILALLTGLLVRLAIPLSITAILIYGLRKLDARWQAEAQDHTLIEKPKCWEVKSCSLEQKETCAASQSPMPCWQVYRLPNGYLRDECLSCAVFRHAPIPA